ncbi:MAG: hypothetical protein IPM39_28935 [Chloroflexi bacterium]|nr:hypothetical protein [Chloroflexota bacterium]
MWQKTAVLTTKNNLNQPPVSSPITAVSHPNLCVVVLVEQNGRSPQRKRRKAVVFPSAKRPAAHGRCR